MWAVFCAVFGGVMAGSLTAVLDPGIAGQLVIITSCVTLWMLIYVLGKYLVDSH